MTTQELHSRLKKLSQVYREVSQLTTRLSKLSPQPGDREEERVEFGAEIHQSLKEAEEDFELLKQELEDITTGSAGGRRKDSEKEREQLSLVTEVGRLGEDLKLARTQFRKAQLQAKRNAEVAKRKDRELLFADVQEGTNKIGTGRRKGQEKFSQDEQILNASTDVTVALRLMHQSMTSELQRSQFAHETLQQSTAALKTLNESYSTLDTLLVSSKSLISTLVSSQKSDTWYLETAFWILVYTIGWLVFRRLFYGPIRYFLYIPTKWLLQLTYWIAQVSVGAFFGAAGTLTGVGQNTTLSVSKGALENLSLKPIAVSGDRRSRSESMASSSVCTGSKGTDDRQPHGEKDKRSEETMSDKVGRMAEKNRGQDWTRHGEKQEEVTTEEVEDNEEEDGDNDEEAPHAGQETILRERRDDEQPNPKKRMWEEVPEVEAERARVRDEL